MSQVPLTARAAAAPAIGGHVVGEDWIGQHRHVAEHVMEDVRLLQVVQLVWPTDEPAGGESPIGQVLEEDVVGDQPRNCHDAPAGQALQLDIDTGEVGYAAAVQVQGVQTAQEGRGGPILQQPCLAFIEGGPDLMVLGAVVVPALVDGPIGRRALRRTVGFDDLAHGARMRGVFGNVRSKSAGDPPIPE